ncbi:hypothetical protein IF1G_08097 [Cordyceps javanica]|uniref:Uncharacterized protein n=1 Tax=Cordyceps javanica TaxID=43265 RepID=A0A545UVM7_9HYPO|nr:hypothetical protein IF1G_08097 [Cordyceps javanica]
MHSTMLARRNAHRPIHSTKQTHNGRDLCVGPTTRLAQYSLIHTFFVHFAPPPLEYAPSMLPLTVQAEQLEM